MTFLGGFSHNYITLIITFVVTQVTLLLFLLLFQEFLLKFHVPGTLFLIGISST